MPESKSVLHVEINSELKHKLKVKAAMEQLTMPEAAEAAIKKYTA